MLILESKQGVTISEGLQYHINTQTPLNETIYRLDSNNFYSTFREARKLLKEGHLKADPIDTELLTETDLGEFGEYNGVKVPLDYPLTEDYLLLEAEYQGKEVQLNKPKRNAGSGKKYMVFTTNPKTHKVIKVTFGDKHGGLSAKITDPKARKAFSARMNCPAKKDKTKPGWWACHLPHYFSLISPGSKNINAWW